MVTVELLPAYAWVCDHCGSRNYQEAVPRVLRGDDQDDAATIRALRGQANDADVPVNTRVRTKTWPSRVACRKCRAIHKAMPFQGAPDARS